MGVLGWIIVGLLAGGLARMATGSEKRGCLGTMVVGILGGVLGGALFNAAGDEGIADFGLWSILVAFIGACALLLVLQALGVMGRRR
ncbi:MAG: GlsB/YeaQ/YmgE family stress response membrane protein [Chloroflexi bacterium]|nr:GlsB/YeaQ/YmgE family stress response membrane protein [Chloroflexota bacterium]